MIMMTATDKGGLKIDIDQLCRDAVGKLNLVFFVSDRDDVIAPFSMASIDVIWWRQFAGIRDQLIQARPLKNILTFFHAKTATIYAGCSTRRPEKRCLCNSIV